MARRSLGTLTLDLIAKIGGFEQGMDRAARTAESRARRIEGSMRKLHKSVTGLFAILAGSAVIRGIVQATVEQENALRKLEQRLKVTGGAAGFSSQQMVGFANDLQKVTTFADDAIVEMQGLLLAFTNIRGDVFKRTTEAVLDLSIALGQDLPASAKLLGLALNNPAQGLSRLTRAGISLDEEQKKLITRLAETGDVVSAQSLLLDELDKRFKGLARTAGDTFGGSLQQLKNAFGDLLEGDTGVAGATKAIKELTSTLQDPQTKAGMQFLIARFFDLVGVIAQVASGLGDAGRELAVFLGLANRSTPDLINLILKLQNAKKISLFDPAELDRNIAQLRTALAAAGDIEPQIDALIQRSQALARQGLLPANEVREYVAALEALKNTLPGAIPAGGDDDDDVVLPPSEEFLKLEAQLKEQIALYGETALAAKIAYQIQSGALEDLSTAEQQQVLRLAQQYDALTRSAEAAKKLKEAFESQTKTYERQIGLLKAITEADKLRFEIAAGNLKDLTTAQQEYLLSLAKQIDQAGVAESLAEINLQILELRGNTAEAIAIRFDMQNADLLESLEQLGDTAGKETLATLRELTLEQARFNELREQYRSISEELAQAEERIRNSQEVGALTELEAMAAIGDARSESAEQLREILALMEAIAAASGNPALIADAERFRAEIEKLEAQTNLLAQRIDGELKDSFSSAFSDLITGAKSAGDAFRSFIDDIYQRMANLVAQNFAEQIFGGFTGSSNPIGGFIGSLFGVGPGRAGGGPAFAGWMHPVNEIEPEYFRSRVGGDIIPLSKMPGGTGMNVTQHFSINAPQGTVSRQTEQQVAAAAARGVSQASRRNG